MSKTLITHNTPSEIEGLGQTMLNGKRKFQLKANCHQTDPTMYYILIIIKVIFYMTLYNYLTRKVIPH